MYLAYYDESGDDGLPGSSPLFVLACIYVHSSDWQDVYADIQKFRQTLRAEFNIPVKSELHTKYLILNKKPYRNYGLNPSERIKIIEMFCQLLSQLPVKIINSVINKTKVTSPTYDVLETAFKYSVGRVERDISQLAPSERFLIISDEGRLGKMRNTTRKIQKINYIPSKFESRSYRKEIKKLIEDPLSKNSKESYLIQLADLVAYVVYLYCLNDLGVGTYGNRVPEEITHEVVTNWLKILEPVLNLKASSSAFGLVCYPK